MRTIFLFLMLLTFSKQAFGSTYDYSQIYRSLSDNSISYSRQPDFSVFIGEQFVYHPDSLGSNAPNVLKNDNILAYKGPSGNFAISFGPYHNGIVGKKIEAFFVFESIDLKPYVTTSNYMTCTRRNWLNKCTSWDTHVVTYPEDSGFILDMVTNMGTRGLDSKLIRAPFTDDQRYDEPGTGKKLLRSKSLFYDLAEGEVIDNLEIRLLNPFGADVDVKIKYAVIRVFPND